jgi:hypothetical protein
VPDANHALFQPFRDSSGGTEWRTSDGSRNGYPCAESAVWFSPLAPQVRNRRELRLEFKPGDGRIPRCGGARYVDAVFQRHRSRKSATRMSKSGHFHGGGTLIGPRNRSWFGQKIPSWTKKTKNDLRTAAKKKGRKTTPKKKPVAVEARRKVRCASIFRGLDLVNHHPQVSG